MSIEIAIFASVILGVVAGLLLENMRRRIEPETAGAHVKSAPPLRLMGPDSARPGQPYAGRAVDSAADLRLVSDAGFASKPLLSGHEADVLAVVESIASEAGLGWRVIPQVRLVDIIASSDAEANAVIGDHRIDMLIVSAQRMPVAAVDYQPLGQVHDDSALRDAVKREALRRAAIPFLEARANEPLDVLRAQILRLAAPVPASRTVRARAPAAAATVAAAAPAAAAVAKSTARPAAKPAQAKSAAAASVAKSPKAAAGATTMVPRPATAAKPAAKPAVAKPAANTTANTATKPAAKSPAKPPEKPAAKAAAQAKPKAANKAVAKDPPAEP